eukprot:6350786-Pyramimonas_sp.AAC.1
MKSGDHDCAIVFGDEASKMAGRAVCRGALPWAKRRGRPSRPIFNLSLAKYEQLFNRAVLDTGLSAL